MNATQSPILALRRAIAAEPSQTAALAVAQAAELARLQGFGLNPQAGCGLHQTTLGDAEVWVEYEIEEAQDGGYDDPSWPASVTVIGMLINGVMLDVDMLDSSVIERWEQEIIDGIADSAEDAQIEAAERRRDEMEAA